MTHTTYFKKPATMERNTTRQFKLVSGTRTSVYVNQYHFVIDRDFVSLNGHNISFVSSKTSATKPQITAPSLQAVVHDVPFDIVLHGTNASPCVVCLSNAVKCINLPCFDSNMCVSCARCLAFGVFHAEKEVPTKTLLCPTCRTPIKEIRRLCN